MKWLVVGNLETRYIVDGGFDVWLETDFTYLPKGWEPDEEPMELTAAVIEVGDDREYLLRVDNGMDEWFAPLERVMSDVTEVQKWGLIETESDLERVVKYMDEGTKECF